SVLTWHSTPAGSAIRCVSVSCTTRIGASARPALEVFAGTGGSCGYRTNPVTLPKKTAWPAVTRNETWMGLFCLGAARGEGRALRWAGGLVPPWWPCRLGLPRRKDGAHHCAAAG